ncbi:MAG: glutamate synthase large subunit [Tindallia sp. MSAO_Bac2]|nr:MAG: glutamate synthase large subunit [Tindallia sp. MSAO_Bac2]
MGQPGLPQKQGLYDPAMEKSNCGVGFVVQMKNQASHEIVKQGLAILHKLKHRGAVGADATTGDGAGMMVQIPHDFFSSIQDELGFDLPGSGAYAVGMVFLPREPNAALYCQGVFEKVIKEEELQLMGWREVPVEQEACGISARATRPSVMQVFVQRGKQDADSFERKLLMVRKQVQLRIVNSQRPYTEYFFVCSLSARTMVYKGQILGYKLQDFYPDLKDPSFKSAVAIVHERYSTNTFPSWKMAHPYRYIAHNGEINTITGNVNWMNAREGVMKSDLFGEEFDKILPVIEPSGSDSASLDNTFEFFVSNGISLEHAMMMLIPEAWQDNKSMPAELQAFYEYHARLMQPWDGPATIAFTDGRKVGIAVDRNGLRPCRYWITDKDIFVMASETGVLDETPEHIVEKGGMQPGHLMILDLEEGELLRNEAVKAKVAKEHAYEPWISENRISMKEMDEYPDPRPMNPDLLRKKQKTFGYTKEEIKYILTPMAKNGEENIGAMGMDIPLAVLSKEPQLLFNYFRQKFAQVTNPAIDSIREKKAMSLVQFLGNHGLLVDKVEIPNKKGYIRIDSPVLLNHELEGLRHLYTDDFKTVTLPITFQTDGGPDRLRTALDNLCQRAEENILQGHNILILSDRNIDYYNAPIPSLLAVSAVHQHLVKCKLRTKADLIVETGDARDVMHLALLIGFGATALNPYIAYETIGIENQEEISLYCRALEKGLLKIIAKMGISTLQSYQGAQTFEIIGISDEVVETYFPGTAARISGIGLQEIAEECLKRHKPAYSITEVQRGDLQLGGELFWKEGRESHIFNPQRVNMLQKAASLNSYEAYRELSDDIHHHRQPAETLRGLLNFHSGQSIPLEEVEPVENIRKRFTSGAVSFGSISKEAHETMAIAMNRMGAKSNSGEGGENPVRYFKDIHGNQLKSASKQVASGRFGVTTHYLVNADEIQIKVGQGAKPGEGGHLPGDKVTVEIAEVRHSLPGIDLISPPPHHDVYSIEDLAQLIFDLKNANPKARINVKLVASSGVGTVAAGVAKAHADAILISGHDGGTGASAFSSMKHVGIPWELGVAEVQQTLMLNNLRSRVIFQTDGKLCTGRDAVVAALLGAEEYGFTTAAMIASGCTMCRQCHRNKCPVGIATQDENLRKKYAGRLEYLENYFTFVAMEMREIMAQLGYRKVDDMIGQTESLRLRKDIQGKASLLDLSDLLYAPELPASIQPRCTTAQDHGLEEVLDLQLLELASESLEKRKPVEGEYPVCNTDRAVGTMLSGEIAKRYGQAGLEDDTIRLKCHGSAGQSFGAFAVKGLTLTLTGDANDYLGKGLSGGKIIVKPEEGVGFDPSQNWVAGNTLLYGATDGEVYLQGQAGHRFAVRNSGAIAVVEGIGSHGCEYMTGGVVVVLGPVGDNFGAGMSGGMAFLLDEDGNLSSRINEDLIELMEIKDTSHQETLKKCLEKHLEYTKSPKAQKLLKDWNKNLSKFKLAVSPIYLSKKALLFEKNVI